MTSPLIHIGMHKTGTTWLQAGLFHRHSAGFHDLTHKLGVPGTLDLLVRTPDLAFSAEQARSAFADDLSYAHDNGLVPVLSHERFSGYPPGGSYDRTIIAHRLAATFEKPRVLLVIREQVSHIDSLYGQYVADGGHLPLRRFLEGNSPFLGRKPEFHLDIFRFDSLIAFYRDVFGPENLLVLPFEQMKADSLAFVRRIASFAGTPPVHELPNASKKRNKRRPMTMQAVRRTANRLLTRTELNEDGLLRFHSLHKPFWRAAPAFRRVTPAALDSRLATRQTRIIRDYVGNFYADGNRRASELLGLDLGEFGYTV